MAGVLFIVNVPHKEFELELRTKDYKWKKQADVKLYKGKSDNTLNEITEATEKLNNSSWGDITQAIKQKRKIKISSDSRDYLNTAFHKDTPLETILTEIISRFDIKNAAWNLNANNRIWQVTFSVRSGNRCEELIEILRTFGIGSRELSSLSMIPCTLYFKAPHLESAAEQSENEESESTTAWSRFSSSVSARTNLAQILEDVRAEAALTFDWLFLLIVAAFVAALGLVENSTVILVASMLISPLMGPITAATLGTTVKDRSLQMMGLKNEMVGLFLCVFMGFFVGLVVCGIDERYGVGDWPTYEMTSRCELRSLWVGVLVALPSGAGVALAILGEYTASLVGVAISAALLPPAVNAGIFWAMSLVHYLFSGDDINNYESFEKGQFRYSESLAVELAIHGAASLALTLVNIICIFVAGVAVYKVKAVSPLHDRDFSWWRDSRWARRTSKMLTKRFTKQEYCWNLYKQWCFDNNDVNLNHDVPEKQADTQDYSKPVPTMQEKIVGNLETYYNSNSIITQHTKNSYDFQTDNQKPEYTSYLETKFSFPNPGFEGLVPTDKNKSTSTTSTILKPYPTL